MLSKKNAVRLFRLFGVNVYVHYSWALVAVIQVYRAKDNQGLFSETPHGLLYHALAYFALFLIVLTHEFGHALACKSVGGTADEIVLWPLGGVAYVRPPQRAGAMLWSIAAGPLVNVALLPLTLIPAMIMRAKGVPGSAATDFLFDIAITNVVLLVFNMLPFYPLDGGQILRSLLWFVCGRGNSLIIASGIGIAGAGALGLAAFYLGDVWLAVIIVYMGLRSFNGIKMGQAIRRMDQLPKRSKARCPSCQASPPIAPLWGCSCGARFDAFENQRRCPQCGKESETTQCPACGLSAPMANWYAPQAAAS